MLPVAILAGGVATRMRPMTETIPKALVDVDREPFIGHQLRLLASNGIERVVICAGHLGDQIERYVGDGSRFGVRAAFVFDGPRLLGTAGALRQALPAIGDDFFVLYGDSYLPCDFAAVQRAFRASGKAALMTVFRNEGQFDHSNVRMENGAIAVYDKRNATPTMRHIDYGLGVLAPAAIARVPAQQPFDLADLYQELAKDGQLAAFEVSERFYEIGSPQGLEDTRRYIAALRRSRQSV
jgi:NDP-sugar pyrophosphorylase family protein